MWRASAADAVFVATTSGEGNRNHGSRISSFGPIPNWLLELPTCIPDRRPLQIILICEFPPQHRTV